MNIRKLTSTLLAATTSLFGNAASSAPDRAWQATYEARHRYFEATVGPLPNDIQKMLSMSGVWPGGGFFVIPAPKLGRDMAVYTTFGFTNPDLPTTVRISDFTLESDGHRATSAEGKLERKEPAPTRPGYSGYGYEILVVAEAGQYWPLGFLQWATDAEIGHDVGLLGRVEEFDGLTVEQIAVGKGQSINVLIAKAASPLPTGTKLPSGRMEILVATTITDEEMRWSQAHGRGALLKKLQDAGVGQISRPGRASVVQ